MTTDRTSETSTAGAVSSGAWPAVPAEAWRELALRELQGAPLERLVTHSPEGLKIEALYDAQPRALPGRELLLAGAGWAVCLEVTQPDPARAGAAISADLQRGAQAVWVRLDERLAAGVAGAPAPTGLHGVALQRASDLGALLAGVDLARVPVTLAVGAAGPRVMQWLEALGVGELRGTLGCDPLAALVQRGELAWPIEQALSDMSEVAGRARARWPGLRAALVDVGAYHDAGATAADQIAALLATGLTYLQALVAGGATLAEASAQLAFATAVGRDLFLEIAKLRAMRLVWARLVAACGGDAAAQRMHLHARGSWRERTAVDPWVGLLRGTGETFAAAVGGADQICTVEMDVALGEPGELARRMALNTQLILAEESQLGRVADPAGGAGYVEALTDGLARAGWTRFQAIERAGGMARALRDGVVQAAVVQAAAAQAQAVASVRVPIVGVSRFPAAQERPTGAVSVPDHLSTRTGTSGQVGADGSGDTRVGYRMAAPVPGGASGDPAASESGSSRRVFGDAPVAGDALASRTGASGQVVKDMFGEPRERVAALQRARLAEPFEALRARAAGGAAERVALVAVGEPAQWRGRVEFCRAYFAVGGFTVVETDGAPDPGTAAQQFRALDSRTAVICSADPLYPELVPALVPLLRAAGAAVVVVAGRPKDQVEALTAAGVDLFVQLGGDAVALLADLQRRLEVGP